MTNERISLGNYAILCLLPVHCFLSHGSIQRMEKEAQMSEFIFFFILACLVLLFTIALVTGLALAEGGKGDR